MAIVSNIRKIASEKKMSLSQIEMKAGLGNGTIGKWNNSTPTVNNLMLVAKVLECTIDELIKD